MMDHIFALQHIETMFSYYCFDCTNIDMKYL